MLALSESVVESDPDDEYGWWLPKLARCFTPFGSLISFPDTIGSMLSFELVGLEWL